MIILVVVVIGLFFFFDIGDIQSVVAPDEFDVDDFVKKELEKIQSKIDNPPKALLTNNAGIEMVQVKDFPNLHIQSIVQPMGIFAVLSLEPSGSGDWCCGTENCDYQCSGTYDYCSDWCDTKPYAGKPSDDEENDQCESGSHYVGNGLCCQNGWVYAGGTSCCPEATPYNSGGFCYAEKPVPLTGIGPDGCPEQACAYWGAMLYGALGSGPFCVDKYGQPPSDEGRYQDDTTGCGEWRQRLNELPDDCSTYHFEPSPSNSEEVCESKKQSFTPLVEACDLLLVQRGTGGTKCCYKYSSGYSTGSGSGSGPGNPLGLVCNSNGNQNDGILACGYPNGQPLCYQTDDTCTSRISCIDKIRYRTCAEKWTEYAWIENQFVWGDTISACPLSQICQDNACIPEPQCTEDEVKLKDGTCKELIRTCIDNNLNNICDADDPIIWVDPDNNVPICADRNADNICDDVESLFCKDSNQNRICDSDEIKWLTTHCEDINGNGICDGIENERTDCSLDFIPVCDISTDITYPSQCFADAFNVVETTSGACDVQPVIIRRDCATGDVPIPSGYICDFETGWLFKRDTIYQNITIDCRTSSDLEGFTCTQIGEDWVWTRTELVEIDCYSRGCPESNQICQAGICLESQARCPIEVDCKETFGEDAVCDEELGLCVAKQYFPVEIIKEVIVEVPVEEKGFDLAEIPIVVKVLIGIGGIFLVLRLLKII